MRSGSATRDITPETSQFLYGYPHVPRMSEGVHDPLQSNALYLENYGTGVLFITNDIIFVTQPVVREARALIAKATGMRPDHILISATHTHSAPHVKESTLKNNDPVIPPVDKQYLRCFTARIAEAGIAAVRNARPATIGYAKADATGIGTNRHDPDGPANNEVPVLATRSSDDGRWIGWMHVCSMHPTVMHEDSRLVSADFPGATRTMVQKELLGEDCAVLHHTGCAGNQSPRHVTRGNTFEEADRIGGLLGTALLKSAAKLVFRDDPVIRALSMHVDPPRRIFPNVKAAQDLLDKARQRFTALQQSGPATEARTAECDVFGAEHRLFMAGLAARGDLESAYAACTPAEIQGIRAGDFCYIGWPAEVYVEYALALKKACTNTFAISLANGTMSGYITTLEAVQAAHYESGSTLFAPETGNLFVKSGIELKAALESL